MTTCELLCKLIAKNGCGHIESTYRCTIPFMPQAGMMMLPYQFGPPMEITQVVWDCTRDLWLLDVEGTVDIKEVEEAFKIAGTKYHVTRFE